MKPVAVFLALACAAPALAQTAAPAAAPKKIEVAYTQFTLPNGLHVILHEDHSVPIATVNTWYHVGSAREKPGRTGFAHLFEHLMFMGSGHVKPGEFDEWLEAAGGENNASTANDRTNYYINVPSNALDLALFLESDRMGYLLDTMTPQDRGRAARRGQERAASELREPALRHGAARCSARCCIPKGHPYHWPVIGYMEDLTAASHEDVVEFFKKSYAPANASLVVAGDIDPVKTRALVEKWFGDVKAAPRAGADDDSAASR